MTQAKPTIALCMIVRDVAPFIERCLGSVLDQVDELCVVDTGSMDDTIAVITDVAKMVTAAKPSFKFKLKLYTPETNPEGFLIDEPDTFSGVDEMGVLAPPLTSHTGQVMLANYGAARQVSFDMAESDFLMWIDSDDIVIGATNLPNLVASMVKDKIDTAVLTYDYEQDDKGQSTCQLLRGRIVRRGGVSAWMFPIHEVLGPYGQSKVYGEVLIQHVASKLEGKQLHRPMLRNYKVLAYRVAEIKRRGEEVHPRYYFYLGNESRMFSKEWALSHFATYIGKGDWPEELCLAHVYSGQLVETDGRWQRARAHYAAGVAVFPGKPEAHFGLARIAYYLKDWEGCIRHHEAGRIALAQASDVLHFNPYDRYFFPAMTASHAYLERAKETGETMKLAKRAMRVIEEGLKLNPKDLGLLASREKSVDIINRTRRTLKIHLVTGAAVEPWGPDSGYDTGIGGSETAAAQIAKAMAERGHDVTIFSECQGFAGVYPHGRGRVEYVHHSMYEMHAHKPVDILLVSRRPLAFLEMPAHARLRVLWLHDNHVGPATVLTSEGLLAADLILPVSKWHRDYVLQRYPFLDPRKVVATRNGIDSDLYRDGPLPKKNKLIYSSSADRGLMLAIDYFRDVRKEVPDAELHIFYGFETVTKIIEKGLLKEKDGGELLEQIEELKRRANATEGVFLRGRIGQRQLSREMRESKVWFYPTWFEESSCITAMEAQAAECTPITTALAALNETVHHGFLLQQPATGHAYKEAFVARAIWCLKNEEPRSALAAVGRENSLDFHSWKSVAEEWEDLLCERLAKGE